MSGNIPGKGWHRRFEKRHAELRSSKPGNLDPKRAQNFNPTNVAKFYDLLKSIFDTYPNLPPEQIWNMDEKGLQLGGGRKRSKKFYHLKTMKKSKFYRIRSDNLELVTIIECISPSGLSVPPSFVLQSGPVPALLDLDVPIGGIATSPNGWTDNELGADWFEQTFVPFATAHKKTNDPILLLLDGHDSHETDGLRGVAYNHNVIVIAFPSKCTHKLQPLDVAVFAHTQKAWTNHCDRRICENVPMNRYNVIPEYMKVRTASMTAELFRTAFSCTGIFPLNPSIFTDEDFAPAKSFSTSMHTPITFPSEAPSSSPLPSDLSDCDTSMDDSNSDSDMSVDDLQAPEETPVFGWDSDPDDPDYEPPAEMSTLPPSPALCESRCDSPASCPSPAAPTTVPTVPAAPPSHISLNSPSHAASSTIPVSIRPAISGTINASPEPSDDVSIESDAPLSRPSSSCHFTRSQKASSSAVSVSVALDHTRAPIPSSTEEMGSEISRLRMIVDLMQKELVQAKAELDASNAHCTIMTRAATEAKAELEQQKRKTRQGVKTSARYVTHPAIRAQWAAEQEEKARKAKELAEKEAQKVANDAARNTQIQEDIQTRVFSGASSRKS